MRRNREAFEWVDIVPRPGADVEVHQYGRGNPRDEDGVSDLRGPELRAGRAAP